MMYHVHLKVHLQRVKHIISKQISTFQCVNPFTTGNNTPESLSNSEASASELLENLEEMFPRYL